MLQLSCASRLGPPYEAESAGSILKLGKSSNNPTSVAGFRHRSPGLATTIVLHCDSFAIGSRMDAHRRMRGFSVPCSTNRDEHWLVVCWLSTRTTLRSLSAQCLLLTGTWMLYSIVHRHILEASPRRSRRSPKARLPCVCQWNALSHFHTGNILYAGGLRL
jgi:hypothetical protein